MKIRRARDRLILWRESYASSGRFYIESSPNNAVCSLRKFYVLQVLNLQNFEKKNICRLTWAIWYDFCTKYHCNVFLNYHWYSLNICMPTEVMIVVLYNTSNFISSFPILCVVIIPTIGCRCRIIHNAPRLFIVVIKYLHFTEMETCLITPFLQRRWLIRKVPRYLRYLFRPLQMKSSCAQGVMLSCC